MTIHNTNCNFFFVFFFHFCKGAKDLYRNKKVYKAYKIQKVYVQRKDFAKGHEALAGGEKQPSESEIMHEPRQLIRASGASYLMAIYNGIEDAWLEVYADKQAKYCPNKDIWKASSRGKELMVLERFC